MTLSPPSSLVSAAIQEILLKTYTHLRDKYGERWHWTLATSAIRAQVQTIDQYALSGDLGKTREACRVYIRLWHGVMAQQRGEG